MGRAVAVSIGMAVSLSCPAIGKAEPPATASSSPAYLRVDLGLNAPEGYISISGGKQIAEIHAVEASAGRGAAATFLGAAYRLSLNGAVEWQVAAELGGSLGFPNGRGFDPDIDGDNPNTRSTWLHGGLAIQRVVPGVVVLAALGLDTLITGSYHVDSADINIVDREAGSVQPYIEVGLGVGF